MEANHPMIVVIMPTSTGWSPVGPPVKKPPATSEECTPRSPASITVAHSCGTCSATFHSGTWHGMRMR